MADPKTPTTLDDVTLPETKPYRVAMLGCTYYEAEAAYTATGPGLVHISKVGTRGQAVNLDEPQARRLLALGAVRETDVAKGYDEMSDTELVEQVKAKGVNVRSSSLDENMPLRLDYIAALQAHDAGVASIAPVQPPPPAPSPPGPRPEHEGITGAATPAAVASTSADPAITFTPDPDEFDGLKGKALTDAAEAAGVDVTSGGSKTNGGKTADEVRAALREAAQTGTTGATPELDAVVAGAPAATEANVNALATYLQRVTPTPEQTIAIARTNTEDPAEGARAVLDAENILTNSDPRDSVARPLREIIGAA